MSNAQIAAKAIFWRQAYFMNGIFKIENVSQLWLPPDEENDLSRHGLLASAKTVGRRNDASAAKLDVCTVDLLVFI